MNEKQYQKPKSNKKKIIIIISVVCIFFIGLVGLTSLAVHVINKGIDKVLDRTSVSEKAVNQYLNTKYGEDSSFEIKKLGGSIFLDSWNTEVECHKLNGKGFKHNIVFYVYTDDNDNPNGDNLASEIAGEILRQETEASISDSKVYYKWVSLKNRETIPQNIDDVIPNINSLGCTFVLPFGISEEEFNSKLSILENYMQKHKIDAQIMVYSAQDDVNPEDIDTGVSGFEEHEEYYYHGYIRIYSDNDFQPIRKLVSPMLPSEQECTEYLNNQYTPIFTLVSYKRGDFQHPGEAIYSCSDLPSPTYNIRVFIHPTEGTLNDNYKQQLNEYNRQLDETQGGYYPGAEKD